MLRSLLVASVIACGSADKPPDSGSGSVAITSADAKQCELAIAHIQKLDQTKSTYRANATGSPKAIEIIADSLAKRSKLLLESCVADHWPAEMTTCMTAATDFEQSEGCAPILSRSLTAAQSQALNTRFEAIEAAAMAAMQTYVASQLTGINALRERMCACKTAACRAAVDKELKAAKAPDDAIVKTSYDQVEIELAACRK